MAQQQKIPVVSNMFVEIRVGDSYPASNNKSDKIFVVDSDLHPDPHVLGFVDLDLDPLVSGMDPDLVPASNLDPDSFIMQN